MIQPNQPSPKPEPVKRDYSDLIRMYAIATNKRKIARKKHTESDADMFNRKADYRLAGLGLSGTQRKVRRNGV